MYMYLNVARTSLSCSHADVWCVFFSIDEDNWRNDYPDEEESPHSSDSEQDDREEYRNWQDIKFYSMYTYTCRYNTVHS